MRSTAARSGSSLLLASTLFAVGCASSGTQLKPLVDDGGGQSDAGTPNDASTASDSSTSYDASTAYDGSTAYDAATPYDGGGYGACGSGYGSGPSDPNALLWSRHGGSPLWDFCQGCPDDTALPPDPRSLVTSGVSDGRAVSFNVEWKNCHVDPAAVMEAAPPKTCGELRAAWARGEALMTPSQVGAGALFSGTDPNSLPSGFGIATFPADSYNKLWTVWGGFLLRPDNFDDLVAQRYGSTFPDTPNPYPLPGEDPNATNGGSGKLPVFFTQLRGTDGSWSGKIGITCQGCHSGEVGRASDGPGLGFEPGGGSGLPDYNLFLRDMLPLGYPASLATIINLNRTRGLNNASDVNLAFFFPTDGTYDVKTLLGLITAGSTAEMNTPAWWNMGHRPAKFIDGVFPMDAPRVDMVFYTPIAGLFGSVLGPISAEGQAWMRTHGPDANEWISALKSPAYPLALNTTLAEEGAVLFHTLNLWDPSLANPIAAPTGGNGSCASCHGVYAPRYFNDPTFVATPALEGVAGNITPMRIIGTDSVRLDTNNTAVQNAGAQNFFGYPQTAGTANDCGPQNQAQIRGSRELGYLAPPLYGVWATAPYLHNGSVPNLWEILQPNDRVPIWRRVSTPARADQPGVVMGFDTDLSRAFDSQKVGWRYDVIPCQTTSLLNPTVTPYVDCNPTNADADPLVQTLLDTLYGNIVAVWNLLYPPILTNGQMEQRKIFNSHVYSHDNHGHAFNSVLTDHQRLAIIEYLKTL